MHMSLFLTMKLSKRTRHIGNARAAVEKLGVRDTHQGVLGHIPSLFLRMLVAGQLGAYPFYHFKFGLVLLANQRKFLPT